MTLTASCLPCKLLHYHYASLALCFSSEPKLQNINNSAAAVKCRFQTAVNVSQEEDILSCFPPRIIVNSHIFAGCLIIHPNRGRSTVHSRLMFISGSNLGRIRFTCMQNAFVNLVMFRNKHYTFCCCKRSWSNGPVVTNIRSTKYKISSSCNPSFMCINHSSFQKQSTESLPAH